MKLYCFLIGCCQSFYSQIRLCKWNDTISLLPVDLGLGFVSYTRVRFAGASANKFIVLDFVRDQFFIN